MAARAAALAFALMLALPVLSAAQQPPAQPLPPFNQARVYAREADFQRAIAPYQAALTANARNARAHYWLGVAYLVAYRQSRIGVAPYASGYLPRGTASLRQAIQLDANYLPAYIALHDAFTLADNLEEAAKVLAEIAKRTTPAGLPYALPSTP